METTTSRIKVKALEISQVKWVEGKLLSTANTGHREYLVRACFTFWDPTTRKEQDLDQSTEVWRRFSDFTSL